MALLFKEEEVLEKKTKRTDSFGLCAGNSRCGIREKAHRRYGHSRRSTLKYQLFFSGVRAGPGGPLLQLTPSTIALNKKKKERNKSRKTY